MALPSHSSVALQINSNNLIKKENYKLYYGGLKKLGQGASGIVYSGINKVNKKKYALKISPVTERKELLNEIGMFLLFFFFDYFITFRIIFI